MNLNQCNFIGRLGKDPESRFAPSGDQITSFSIAISEKWKDKQGQAQERTEWVNCTAFGNLAKICGDYLTKGSLVYISGKMQTDKYQDKQTGVDKYSTKINVREMKMLSTRAESNGQPQQNQQSQQSQQKPQQQQAQQSSNEFNDSFDSDIPF